MGRINLDVTDLVAKREEDQQLDNVHRAMIGIGTSLVPPDTDQMPDRRLAADIEQAIDELNKAGFDLGADELNDMAEYFEQLAEEADE